MIKQAIVRRPGENFHHGLTEARLGPPNLALMKKQHAAYVNTLRTLGIEVTELDPLPDCPDAYFVEDVAVITNDLAILTRPGESSRRAEVAPIKKTIAGLRPIAEIESPGTLDGGDVLAIGHRLWVGLSRRTNAEGANQLKNLLRPLGYDVLPIEVTHGLHLKSSVNVCHSNLLVATAQFAAHPAFSEFEMINLDPEDSGAANVMPINDFLLIPTGYPKFEQQLRDRGVRSIELDISEVEKMDGGLTCMSLRFNASHPKRSVK